MTIVNVLKIPNQIQFGLEKSLCFASRQYLDPFFIPKFDFHICYAYMYKQASPLMGKRHLRRVQNISVFLLEEVPRVAASHGYDHNSI